MTTNTLSEFKEVYSYFFDKLMECGVNKPVTAIVWEDKISLVQSVTLHYVLLKSKGEIDQFREGLSCLGTRSYITKYPRLLKEFFTIKGKQSLSAGNTSLLICVY